MQTIKKDYVVDKKKIGFIRFIFEAHEGIAVVSTIDSEKGHIRLAISPDRQKSAGMIVDDLKKEFLFDEI